MRRSLPALLIFFAAAALAFGGGSAVAQTATGCIDIIKETFDYLGAPIRPVAQFNFELDGAQSTDNDGSGRARFNNVTPGSHTVREVLPRGWIQTGVTPSDGVIQVSSGGSCAVIIFKNRQENPAGELTVDLRDSADPVNPDEIFTYFLRIHNNGPGEARDVVVTQTLPDRVRGLNASDGGAGGGQTITWRGITVPGNGDRELRVDVRVVPEANDGDVLVSRASVGNSADEERTRVRDDLDDDEDHGTFTVTISDSRDPVQPNEEFDYIVDVQSTHVDEEQVDLRVILDRQTSYRSSSDAGNFRGPTEVFWRGLSVPGNGTRTVRVSVRVNRQAQNSEVLSARAIAGAGQDNEDTRVTTEEGMIDRTTPPPEGDIVVEKRADRGEVQPEDIVTYTVTILNNTATDYPGVTVLDTFWSSQLEVVDSAGGDTSGRGHIRWNIPLLHAGETVTYRYRSRVRGDLSHGTQVKNLIDVQGPFGSIQKCIYIVVINRLPVTGAALLGRGTKNPFVRPWRGGNDDAGGVGIVSMLLFTTLALAGLAGGTIAGKRYTE